MLGLKKREWCVLAAIFIYSFIPTFGGIMRLVELAGGVAIIPENPRAVAEPSVIVIHVLGSFVFCLVGALQFIPTIREKHRTVHRLIGYVCIIAGSAAVLTGLQMTLFFDFPKELQGPVLFYTRIVVSFTWIWFLFYGVAAIWLGRYRDHAVSMLRAYALAQGASTQAMVGIILLGFGIEPTGFWRDIFMAGCWFLNLWFVQFLISFYLRFPRQVRFTKKKVSFS